MAIEAISDLGPFERWRIPLHDFVVFPEPDKQDTSVHLQYPDRYYRACPGFYLTMRFFEQAWSCLPPRPACPRETHLFVWRLKETLPWAYVEKNFDGKKQPVPWWVQQPLLRWQATGEQSYVVPDELGAIFWMKASRNDQDFDMPVSLTIHFGALHTEWWVDIFDPVGMTTKIPKGQVFLSVA